MVDKSGGIVMKRYHLFLKWLQDVLVVLLATLFLWVFPWQMASFAAISPESIFSPDSLNQADIQHQAIEKEKQAATAEAESSLDQEAIAALEETRNAIAAIEQGKTHDAIQALERATGKIDILVARYPELALVPVSTQVAIIDVAPADMDTIERIRNQIKSAINAENYPAARELLNNLMSEIRTTTLNLPLATYLDAMKEAARWLKDGQTEQAQAVLQSALSTLVLTEQSRPLPLVNAQTKLMGAVAVADFDQNDAQRLLEEVRNQLKLAKELGYARRDRNYAELDQTIQTIERQLKTNQKSERAFAELQDKFSTFFNRISEVQQAA
jgi:hypothetical protein